MSSARDFVFTKHQRRIGGRVDCTDACLVLSPAEATFDAIYAGGTLSSEIIARPDCSPAPSLPN